MEEPIVLGAEYAAAARKDRLSAEGPSPLDGIAYSAAEARLWRWTDAPADALVGAFCARRRSGLPAAGLRMADFSTLLTFARRSVLAALRTGDATHVSDGFEAVAAVDLERVDWRDAAWAAGLLRYAAGRVGLPAEALEGPVSRALPDTIALLSGGAGPGDLAAWGMCEVETPDGLVLLDREGRGNAGRALAPALLALAGAVEADRYDVDAVSLGARVAPAWLGGRPAQGVVRCGNVLARLRDDDPERAFANMLLVYLAETRTEARAAALAASLGAANALTLGVSRGRLCALLITRSAVQEQEAAETDLSRFAVMLEEAVTGPA